jgi:site-specific DNA-methyltransferase (adenine-specific)
VGVELRCGDCLTILPTLADESVDAVVTDPPFGIGFLYGEKKEETSDPTAYWEWLRPRYEEALRCLKPGGLMAVWQAQLYFRHFWDWFGDGIRIYIAAKNFVQLRKIPIQYGYDPVVMFYKPGADPLCPEKASRSLDWSIAITSDMRTRKATKGHPCPRPPGQVREIVENFTLPGGLVLDPFVGSGTTLVACMKTGRNGIGFEIDPDYIPIIERRLSAAETPLLSGACL